MRTYTIIYSKNGDTIEVSCTELSLEAFVDKIKKEGANIIDVIEHERIKTPTKVISQDEKEKRRYYNTQYQFFYRKFKSGKINENQFSKMIEILKKERATSVTTKEFKDKFENYKKTLEQII